LSCDSLRSFLAQIDLLKHGLQAGARVAAVMPNGPELATLFVAVIRGFSFAPLNPSLTMEELAFELTDYACQAMVIDQRSTNYNSLCELGAKLCIAVINLERDASTTGMFRLAHELTPIKLPGICTSSSTEALVLHTSGTTSKPKTTSLSKHQFLTGAICVQSTLRIPTEWTCINIMPLFHIHGLVANLLVSILAGCRLVCSLSADPETFFQWLQAYDAEYYSAVPTLHLSILAQGQSMVKVSTFPKNKLQLIRNCSAALLHPTACDLASMFSMAKVLPTYAMSDYQRPTRKLKNC